MDVARQALEAYGDEHYEQALELYNQALQASPGNADLLSRRAACYLNLGKDLEAINDAKQAIQADSKNSRAFLTRGEAMLNLEEFEGALEALTIAQELGSPQNKCKKLIVKCQAQLEAEGIATKSTDYQTESVPSQNPAGENSAKVEGPNTPESTPSSSQNPNPAQETQRIPAQPKYRHQFFQTQKKVEVAVLAKGLTEERVTVDIGESSLLVVIRDQSGSEEYRLDIKLADKVVVNKSISEIFKTKLQICLHKANLIQWPQLEDGKAVPKQATEKAPSTSVNQPWAFKGKPKDWNKLESELKKEEKDEKLDGDAGLNKFFQDIYAGCDEDSRRAMNKSFQESNGAVLSTDWKEISKKKTEFKGVD